MANANTQVTIEGVHEAICTAVKNQFKDLKTVEAYRPDRKSLPLPACLIEMTEIEASDQDDMGTGQLPVIARFEAHLILYFRQSERKNERLEIRKLACAFASFLRLNRFGLPIGPAQFQSATPDDFNPDFDQYECWKVEWSHQLDLGNVSWKWADYGEPPKWKTQVQTNKEGYLPL